VEVDLVERSTSSRKLTLGFHEFGCERLALEGARDHLSIEELVCTAALYYLSELPSRRIATQVPRWTGSGLAPSTSTVRLDLDVNQDAWTALGAEAARQRVPLERLLEHATIYYLADVDSGRLASAIAEEMEPDSA
jgi:hypothetical protein